eukprot:gene58731-78357_t
MLTAPHIAFLGIGLMGKPMCLRLLHAGFALRVWNRSMHKAEALRSARNYTLILFDCLAAAGYDRPHRVPYLATINPPLWELGHTAWFAEWFILREAVSSHPADAQRPSLLTRGDDLFDSNTVGHRARW